MRQCLRLGDRMMSQSTDSVGVYLEVGRQRTFAGAIDWPGWCRLGRDEGLALRALADSAPRYVRVLRAAQLPFPAPADASAFAVVERVVGTTTTDFGAPDVAPSSDARPIDGAELRRLQALLRAYWQAFDAAIRAASGKELRKGPRGGGRDLGAIAQHVLGAEQAYLARLARKPPRRDAADRDEEVRQ